MIGQLIGQYRITQKLGEGGMGTVYKAVDTMIDREVAIKMLRPEIARKPDLLRRFRAEATTVAKLNHAGIATLYNFTQHHDDYFMVMEYVPGKTLEEMERERGALPWQTAVPLFEKILDAIQPAHDFGILHRDIKPANVMLTTWGAVKVMDFGIARMLGSARMTREGSMVGTIEYIPPERVQGKESDARGDIYSLGIVLFELLCGRLPFQSDSEYEIMRCHVQAPLPSLSDLGIDVPVGIENAVRKAAAKSADERFGSCDEFIHALQSASGHLTIGKKAIIELVGERTVQQLGTAGHQTPPAGSLPEWAPAPRAELCVPAPPAVPADSRSGRPDVEVFPGTCTTPLSYLRIHWRIAAVSGVILSIVAGLLIGLAARHGNPPDIANVPTPVQAPPSPSPNTPSPGVDTVMVAPPAAATPPEQPAPEPKVIGQPVTFSPSPDTNKPAPTKKAKNLRDQSLKALDQ